VINRYEPAALPAIAFIRSFGLKHGAIASTVAHDCHNIIAVGVDDESITAAINSLIEAKGGISVAKDASEVDVMPLPVAGLMSADDGYTVAESYSRIDQKAKELGTTLKAPFMTLSFMALLVIPSLKLSDKGLFDGKRFAFADVLA
jgi:adenine deaminase